MEPADGGQAGHEPLIGWRVWVLANNCLYSIAKNAFWRPGENQAECLVGHKRDIPVPSCHCGFWALHNPVAAIHLAAQVECGRRMGSGFTVLDPHRTVAVGLILGYGATAVHGWEGYRAGLASIACIFADAPEALVTENADLRRAVAHEYGVPCIALEAAISIGFLQEFGVHRHAVEQLRAWMAMDRPLAQAPERQTSIPLSPRRNERQASELTERERQIAGLVAQGLTNKDIARAMFVRQRAVEFHIDRLKEKIRVRSRRDQ
ncbi:MAG TPA: LuxR C-terminal-related transcriptional regulator [Candidatus Dormibacteraeota bacterium]|nr:LuxR C-terminal-related transcriptional regulator [Candidatus Dormibacteraeota bacterium]